MLLALALPVFLAAGFPLEGWAGGTVAWVAQRVIARYATRRAAAQEDPRRTVGIITASMIGRGWLVAVMILGVGLAFGDDAGLSAAVLVPARRHRPPHRVPHPAPLRVEPEQPA